MPTLKQRIVDLTNSLVVKLNELNTLKEDKSNKRSTLESTDDEHYPNVQAVKESISAALEESKNYADDKVEAIPEHILATQKGVNGGVAELDSEGKVPTSQLPLPTDDVIALAAFVSVNPTSGMVAGQKRYNNATKKIFISISATEGIDTDPELGKIYINTSDELVYRWSGTNMSQLGANSTVGSDMGVLELDSTFPTTDVHRGDVFKAGIYVNLGNIEFTQEEVDNNYCYIYSNDGVYRKATTFKPAGGTAETVTLNESIVSEEKRYSVSLHDKNGQIISTSDEWIAGGGLSGGGDGQTLKLNTVEEAETVKYSMSMLDKEGNTISTSEEWEAGTSGGNAGIVFRVKTLTLTNTTIPENKPFLIDYEWSSIDNGVNTGTGTLVVKVNGNGIINKVTAQEADVVTVPADKLIAGSNTITLSVTDSYGNTRTITYVVAVVALRLSSPYDRTTINDGAITFRYVPVGNLTKTVRFFLDGEELPEVITTVTNRQLTYIIPSQPHGAHKLVSWIEANIDGTLIKSNEIEYQLISTEVGNNTPIVAIDTSEQVVEQYNNATLQYIVYSPITSKSLVSLKVNGVLLTTLTVQRSLQTWSYKAKNRGSFTMTVECDGVSKTSNVEVVAASLQIEAELADLELYLTAQNRNNSEVKKESWSYNSTSCMLTGFNYSTNGWITTDLGSVLRVDNGARVTIPFKPFSKDLKQGGKTIELEFASRGVKEFDASIIKCISGTVGFKVTSQTARFSSEQTALETNYKEGERVRVTILISKTANNRILALYINGIMSGIKQYPVSDSFLQSTPENIIIGSDDAGVDIFNIRVYDNDLTQYQILNNYLADLDDLEKRNYIYKNNQIYDDFGNISYDKSNVFLPCLTIIGTLPTFKGDKLKREFEYRDLDNPSKSFTATGVIDVQGTSSQYYPRKNWKIKFNNIKDNDEVITDKYKLRDNSVPESTYTFKADFAESSGSHNTGAAKFIGDALLKLGFKTPVQTPGNENIRTTVDGFPCLVYHKETPDSDRVFTGKYNFNNDKTDATFGFTGTGETIQCWETKNNTSSNILFTDVDFDAVDANGPVWLNDFEARFPDKYKDPTKLRRLCEWIESTKGDVPKFKAEVNQYFNMDFLIFYYVITEFFGMVDQRGKNMFLTVFPTLEGDRWYNIFYDNDTILGINNEGAIAFPYDIEYHDVINSGQVFNAEKSVLWNNVEQAFFDECTALYKRLRSEDIITYPNLIKYFNTQQSDKWSESIYNEDSKFKYLDPLTEVGNGSYLYAAQGSRVEHRKWWLANRVSFLDGKYQSASSQTDFATMRVYTPAQWSAVPPNADFTIDPISGGYTSVKWGSYTTRGRLKKGVPTTFLAPDITFNDTETIIYGASIIKSFGSLASKYVGTLDVSKAVNLTELIIGSDLSSYYNNNLTHLTLGNNTLLKTINLGGCLNLKENIDLSRCTGIETVKATRSGVLSVTLPEGGSIKVLALPKVTSLILKNQINITNEGITLSSYNSLSTLVLENCPNVNAKSIIDLVTNLQRARIIGISGSSENADSFYNFTKIKGIDDNGNTTQHAVIQGSWSFNKMYTDDYNYFLTIFPDFAITVGTLTDIVEFESSDVKEKLLTSFDTNNDGDLSLTEIRAIDNLGKLFTQSSKLYKFNEFRLFTNVVSVSEGDLPTNMSSLTLPDSLRRIEDFAYVNTSILLNYSKLEYIGSRGLSGIENTELKFESLNYLGVYGIAGDYQSLDLSGCTFTELEEYAIASNSLTNLVLPDSLLKLNARCIVSQNVNSITTERFVLNIPPNIKDIPREAFSACLSSISKVNLNQGLETMQEKCFSGANMHPSHLIKNTVIPSSVTFISNAFRTPEINQLGEITAGGFHGFVIEGTVPFYIEYGPFGYASEMLKMGSYIYVADNLVNTFKQASGWSGYATVIKPLSEKID